MNSLIVILKKFQTPAITAISVSTVSVKIVLSLKKLDFKIVSKFDMTSIKQSWV